MAAPQQQRSQEIATRTPVQDIVARIRGDQFLEQVRSALPGNIRPDRFQRAVVTAVMQNPEVVVHPESLFQSAIQCAQDGLIPDGREAAFVMFKEKGEKKVQYLPMIGGYRKIAAKHGITLVADVVREGDFFDWSKVPPQLEHRPASSGERGEIAYAYAVAFDADWRFVAAPIVMDVPEIEKVRAVSRAATSEYGPWVQWWDRMACKTVARRLFNELPLGDLEEVDARIVEQADADASLARSNGGLTVDEADIAAGLAGALPPRDSGPDDEIDGEVVNEHDDEVPPVADDAPQATPEQHAQLLELVVQLGDAVADVDWPQAVNDYVQQEYGCEQAALTVEEMEQVYAYFRAQLPAPKQRRRAS